MGGTISLGPSSMSERKRKLKQSKKERERANEEESRRRRLLEQYGVLIPPVFLANKTDNPPLSSRVWERFLRESSSSSQLLQQQDQQQQQQHVYGSSDLLLWAYRRTKREAINNHGDDDFDAGPLLGQTLLTEYTTPGLFLSLPIASSGANDGGRFLAALTQQPFSEQTPLPSFLSLTKCFRRNSFLFFPFPWKVETFLPQHVLLSNATAGILPSSMRFTADLSSPSNENSNSNSSSNSRTQVSWTTHFQDQDSSSTRGPSFRLWTKLRGSSIEAETVRPDFLNSGITLRAASSMTLDCFLDNVVLETCRVGNDAYHNRYTLENNTSNNTFENLLRKFRKQKRQEGNRQDENVRIRVAAEYKESIIASSTNVSLVSLLGRDTGSIPVVTVTDTLLSMNLNGGGGHDETCRQQQQNPPSPTPPPLWLTLKQAKSYTDINTSSWSLNLSQVVTFDREIWNILEDRAPKVRNHVGWVCQIERFLNHNGTSTSNRNHDDGKVPSSASVLSVGASAQFNRNIAAKVILESKIGSSSVSSSLSPSETASSSTTATTAATVAFPSSTPSAALKFAVVFKRWLEPNASLSVIQKIDLLTGKWSFLGVGLEIEQDKQIVGRTSSTSNSKSKQHLWNKDSKERGAEYRDTADMDSTSSVAPPTRIRVEMPSGKQ